MNIKTLFNYEFRGLPKHKEIMSEFSIRKASGFKNKKVICRNGVPVLFVRDGSSIAKTASDLQAHIEDGFTNLKLDPTEY